MAPIVVGMSGGVDSSVAALLLKRQGYDVIGVFMNNWEEKDERGVCTAEKDYQDVRVVCDRIGIPYYSVNFAKEYRERVFAYFLDEYRKNRTPNPDVLCNREIKFNVFLKFARSLGAEKMATGHFARLGEQDGKTTLLRAADENKDQTYFLYMVNHQALSQAMFPVGGLTKAEIREIARQNGLATSEKKDSTGVCFIGERDFKPFLQGFLPAQPGPIVTETGETLGRHDGLMYYTLGQRRGLGIGGQKGGDGGRWFVIEKDLERNRLVVAQGEDSPKLYTTHCRASQATWIAGEAPAASFDCTAKYRYRQPDQRVHVELGEGGELLVTAYEPQRAVTPGQSVVLYEGEKCLGGAIADETWNG